MFLWQAGLAAQFGLWSRCCSSRFPSLARGHYSTGVLFEGNRARGTWLRSWLGNAAGAEEGLCLLAIA